MRKYSGSSTTRVKSGGGNGDGNTGLLVLGGLALVAFVMIGGGGSNGGIQDISSNLLESRLEDFRSGQNAQRILEQTAASAKTAQQLVAEHACIKIYNTEQNAIGAEAGEFHVALSKGAVTIDAVTGSPLPPGQCVMDHLGNVAVLDENSRASEIFSDPKLAMDEAIEFQEDLTRTLNAE